MAASTTTTRLVILSGPSCAGKTPLKRALHREFPALGESLRSPVLYNSRAPRPTERDGEEYHFRKRHEIEALRRDDRYLVIEARSDLQAVNLEELESWLKDGDVLYEGQVDVALALKRAPRLRHARILDVFLSPVSGAELRAFQQASAPLAEVIADLMRRRLVRRLQNQGSLTTLPALQDIETRACAAYAAMQRAPEFSFVIPNHDGEDSDHWSAFPCSIGDARRCLQALVSLLRGRANQDIECWPRELLDAPSNLSNAP